MDVTEQENDPFFITACQGHFVTGIGSADHENGNSRI